LVSAVASVDFKALRSQVSMAQVLELLGFEAAESRGEQLRGKCPLHPSNSPQSRSFSANLKKNAFRCFRCGAAGNQLDLWAAATKQPLHAAALVLCKRLNLPVPKVERQIT
jgi:DNA primase